MTTAKNVSARMDQINAKKAQAFQQKVMDDVGAFAGVACAAIGDRLGLYAAMAEHGPITAEQLAAHTGTDLRYVHQWLINQGAGGYVEYDRDSQHYTLTPEQAAVLVDENSPYFSAGAFQSFTAFVQAASRISECFRTGKGMSWSEHHQDVFEGTERMFKPLHLHFLVSQIIPSIPGLKERLEAGIKVADVGCGHGLSTITMGAAFPRSEFTGFDNHAPSIDRARQNALRAGVMGQVSFAVSPADDISGSSYGLISFLDSLHDMGDPVGACRKAASVLAQDGCLLVVEPMAGNKVEENFNSIGRAFSGASVFCCTPNAVASGKHALGTIAPDCALEEVVKAGGFLSFRRVFETPFNRVFEARLSSEFQ